jgi:hypothetical protein
MRKSIFIITILSLFLAPGLLSAKDAARKSGETVKGVVTEGACAIVGMSAEQSQLAALQRARAAAIEQAAGVHVTSSTLVTNYTVAADFIKTYARGFIVREKVVWLPLGQYQKDASFAPIPEYRVKITADVYVPKKKTPSVGLKAKLNNTVFRSGEKLTLTVRSAKSARFAVFNIMADDRVAIIFPNSHDANNLIPPGGEITYPAKDDKIELEMQTLPDHVRDAEAYFVIAWDSTSDIRIQELFPEPVSVSVFFAKLAEIADRIEDVILPYEVVAQ